jgi:hypothetical protein
MLAMLLPSLLMPPALFGNTARVHAVAARPASSPRRAAVSMYWRVFPRDGMDNTWSERTSFRAGLKNEYKVEPGRQQALGCYDMTYSISGVIIDPAQCIVQLADDGGCIYAYAQGVQPTGWRTRPDEPWNWMMPGESVVLQSGNKVSLDCTNPENAVYKFEKAGRFLNEAYLESQGPFNVVTSAPPLIEQPGNLIQLPPGWVAGIDQASGQQYYYNDQTGQSQWDPPPQ